jgi:GWxTD domain-containing protein
MVLYFYIYKGNLFAMKVLKEKNIIVILIILIFFPALALGNEDPLFHRNLNYRYKQNVEIRFKSKIAYYNQNATVFLKIDLLPDSLFHNYTFKYKLRESYSSKENIHSGTIDTYLNLLKREENRLYLKFETWLPQKNGILVITACNTTTKSCYDYDILINYDLTFAKTDLLLFDAEEDLPVFDDFIKANQKVKVVSVYENVPEIFAYRYVPDFKPATPPMSTKNKAVEKTMDISAVYKVRTNQEMEVLNAALYFLQKDTTTMEGISFRVTSSAFPRFAEVQELINPLVYISTSAERSKLEEAKDKKRALDEYWLEITQSQERARRVISDFYKNVYAANNYFTQFKDGWKTDRGMIYTIFGEPDEVYRNADSEEWYYHNGGSITKLSFTFVKVKNIFTDDHYELVRKSNYEKYWFRTVEQWRKGRKQT